MTKPPPQLTLDLAAQPAAQGRAAFFPAPANEAARAALADWRAWPGGTLLLIGPGGSGKTHLAHIWAEAVGARVFTAAGLKAEGADALAGAPGVLDGAEAVAGDAAAEVALFHLWNAARARGRPLLLTAANPPAAWGLHLPDLKSRVEASAQAHLNLPDEALLAAVLVKLFADRQLRVEPALITYLVPRMTRSIGAARDLVAALDAKALAEGRGVTRALAASVLGLSESEGDDG